MAIAGTGGIDLPYRLAGLALIGDERNRHLGVLQGLELAEQRMAEGLGAEMKRGRSPESRTLLRNYLRTWSPFYDPAKIPMPPGVADLLSHFSEVAGRAA